MMTWKGKEAKDCTKEELLKLLEFVEEGHMRYIRAEQSENEKRLEVQLEFAKGLIEQGLRK